MSWIVKVLEKLEKLRVANHARLMIDNQRTLNRTHCADVQYREFGQRLQQHLAREFIGMPETKDRLSPVDDMNINIDSPVNNNYPQVTGGLRRWLWPVLIGLGLAAGLSAGYFLGRVPRSEVSPDRGYTIERVP